MIKRYVREIERYYNQPDVPSPGQLYFDHNKFRFAFTLMKIEQYVKIGSTVLDVGAGSRFFSYVLMERGFNVSSCDYHDVSDVRYIDNIPHFKYNINNQIWNGEKFDAIVCSEVLEHTMLNLKNGVKRLSLFCHNNSTIIISVPNIYSINHLLRIIRGIHIVENYPDEVQMHGEIVLDMRDHKRECTKKEVIDAALFNNLKVCEVGNCHSSIPFNYPMISKIIPPQLRQHIYGVFKAMSTD